VVSEPLPSHCPHCGQKITRVRRQRGIPPLVIVLLLFGLLMALVAWLLQTI
jgi:hypothetical protein